MSKFTCFAVAAIALIGSASVATAQDYTGQGIETVQEAREFWRQFRDGR